MTIHEALWPVARAGLMSIRAGEGMAILQSIHSAFSYSLLTAQCNCERGNVERYDCDDCLNSTTNLWAGRLVEGV